jgi:hypothetical protein
MFWRTRRIVALQFGITLLCWSCLWVFKPFAEPMTERIANLPPQTHQNLSDQLKNLVSQTRLRIEDEEEIRAQVQKLSMALGWKVKGDILFYARMSEDGRVPVDMKWKSIGSVLELPIYLEGLNRLSAQGVLEKIKVDFKERGIEFQLRFIRSNLRIPTWIEKSNEFSKKEKALLRQGWSLQYWKAFQQFQAERESQRSKNLFLIELSRRLSLLRTTDRYLYWSSEQGFIEKSF